MIFKLETLSVIEKLWRAFWAWNSEGSVGYFRDEKKKERERKNWRELRWVAVGEDFIERYNNEDMLLLK